MVNKCFPLPLVLSRDTWLKLKWTTNKVSVMIQIQVDISASRSTHKTKPNMAVCNLSVIPVYNSQAEQCSFMGNYTRHNLKQAAQKETNASQSLLGVSVTKNTYTTKPNMGVHNLLVRPMGRATAST